jgi:hypothetical protein
MFWLIIQTLFLSLPAAQVSLPPYYREGIHGLAGLYRRGNYDCSSSSSFGNLGGKSAPGGTCGSPGSEQEKRKIFNPRFPVGRGVPLRGFRATSAPR